MPVLIAPMLTRGASSLLVGKAFGAIMALIPPLAQAILSLKAISWRALVLWAPVQATLVWQSLELLPIVNSFRGSRDLVLGLLICSTPWLERTREAALRGGEPQGHGDWSRPARRETPWPATCPGNSRVPP